MPNRYSITLKNQTTYQKRSEWLFWLSFIFAAVLLYYSLRGLDWLSFWNTLKNGQYKYLILTIPIASINYFIRAFRWKILLDSKINIPVVSVFWTNMVGYLGNAFLPARAGEFLRSAFLGQKSQLGTSYVLATALVERMIDMLALLLIGSISLLWQGSIPSSFVTAIKTLTGIAILGFTIVVVAPSQERRILRVCSLLPVSEQLSLKISEQVSRFLLGMRSLQSVRTMLPFFFLTGIIWLVDAGGVMLGVRIIAKSLSLTQALILLSALGLSSAVPSTPGYVGVYQFTAITVLMPFDFSRTDALSYILIAQIANYLIISFWGIIGLWKINRSKVS